MSEKKQPTWRRYTFIALILSGLSLLFTIGVLVTRGLLVTNVFTGTTLDTLDRLLLFGAGIFVITLAVYIMLEPEKIRQVLTGRQAKYGSNAVVMTIAFVGILIFANVIVYSNPYQWDVTEDKSNTLAPETVKALESLKQPVSAVAFYSALSTDTATQLLEKFKSNSKGMFSYQFVNPDTNPVAAREAGITGDGKIMLVMGDRKEIASTASETELTKALIRLTNPEARAVYFLTGHGEASLDSSDTNSFSIAKQTLESKNYTVNSLNLLADNKIPSDALAIIIAGPSKPVSDQEVQLLKKYVDGGGSLIVMENPKEITDFGTSPDPLAQYLTDTWGITLDNDIIIDLNSQSPLNAISASANQHPITQNLTGNYIVIMPQARSLSVKQGMDNITLTPLILTSTNTWGETEFTSAEGAQISFDPQKDIQGPLAMAVAGENSATKGRVVVFGNSLFASDQVFDAYGNGNMFINSVDWAAEQESLINITPNTPKQRTFLPPSQWQWYAVLLGTVFILPGIAIVSGIYTWIVRRRQG